MIKDFYLTDIVIDEKKDIRIYLENYNANNYISQPDKMNIYLDKKDQSKLRKLLIQLTKVLKEEDE